MRQEEREKAAGGEAAEEGAQSSQVLVDAGSTRTLIGKAHPLFEEVITELSERMSSPEAKAHPVFKEALVGVSERMRHREAITFTDDQGPDGKEEPRFEH